MVKELSVAKTISVRQMTLAAFAAVAAFAVASATLPVAAAPLAENADIKVEELMKPGELPDYVLGKEDAPNTIVEYSSLTCPHCADFHRDVLTKIKLKYIDTGKAKYILREFPLDNVAAAGFMLGRCVDKAKYYDFIEMLYANQEAWAFKDQPLVELQKFSKQAGFTDDSFTQCLRDEKNLKHIEWVRERGNKSFAIHATPTFFINGKRLKGGNGIEKFDEILEPQAK